MYCEKRKGITNLAYNIDKIKYKICRLKGNCDNFKNSDNSS